jgi:hypothetical protein
MATDATNTAAIAATIPVLNMLFIVSLLDPIPLASPIQCVQALEFKVTLRFMMFIKRSRRGTPVTLM